MRWRRVLWALAACGAITAALVLVFRAPGRTVEPLHWPASSFVRPGYLVLSVDGQAASVDGYVLTSATGLADSGAPYVLWGPGGREVFSTSVQAVDPSLTGGPDGPVLTWLDGGFLSAWSRSGLAVITLNLPSRGAWSAAVAADSRIVVLQAISPIASPLLPLSQPARTYAGSVLIRTLGGRLVGRIVTPRGAHILALSASGHRILLTDYTEWTDHGHLVGTFSVGKRAMPAWAGYLVDHGQEWILPTTTDRWRVYRLDHGLMATIQPQRWLRAAANVTWRMAAVPWSSQQVVYSSLGAFTIRNGRRVGSLRLRHGRLITVEDATITPGGLVRILAVRRYRGHEQLVLTTEGGRVLWATQWPGPSHPAFMSAGGRTIVVQNASTIRVYELTPVS